MIDNRILDPGNPFIPVKENADLTVSCVVDEGNPKPSLSWELTLGSLALLDAPEVPLEVLNLTETLRDQKVGARNDARLGRVLRAHHNATLTCFVRHIALEQPLNVSVLLNVQCKYSNIHTMIALPKFVVQYCVHTRVKYSVFRKICAISVEEISH